ncbi:SOS response-associated peptidase [Haloferacaceae archaeon DSL9]
MCGRYTLTTPASELEDRFGATFDRPPEPRYNCAPGQELPVITNDAPETFQSLTWGLTPSWADGRRHLINARAETVAEKRSFASAYESRRCLVPADGFYEWAERDGHKQPYRVAFDDDRPFAMAGLWERWTPPTRQTGLGDFGASGAETATDDLVAFSILTTKPNELIAELHDRMAVVLAPAEEDQWLHGDADERAALLDPYPDDALTAFPVSDRVNSPKNDDRGLLDPFRG